MPLKFFKIINIFTTESDQRHLALFYNLVLCKLFEVYKDTVMVGQPIWQLLFKET